MPTFYFGGPGIDPTRERDGRRGRARSWPASRLPRRDARPVRARAARVGARAPRGDDRAGEPDLGPWTAFVAALGDGRALYVLRHTGQPPAQDELEFDFELANGDPTARRRSATAATSRRRSAGDLFADGARIRLQTPRRRHPLPHRLRLRPALVGGAGRARRRPLVPAVRSSPATVGTILCTDLNGWFGERPAGIPLPRWHTGNRVEPLLDGIETFTRLWGDLQPLRADGAPPATTDGTPLGVWMAGLVLPRLRARPGRRGVEVRRPRQGADQRRLPGAAARREGVHVRGHGVDEQERASWRSRCCFVDRRDRARQRGVRGARLGCPT